MRTPRNPWCSGGRFAALLLFGCAVAAGPARSAESFGFGLSTSGARLDALAVASRPGAPTVVLVGGLAGSDASVATVRAAVDAYARRRDRPVNVLAVPLANPDGVALQFPPTGAAYREHSESHALWRWLGSQAPDLVLIAGEDAGLAAALGTSTVADMGRIPARRWSTGESLAALRDTPAVGGAR